jgi:hypothetical protein
LTPGTNTAKRKKNRGQGESDLIDLTERMVQDSDPSIRKVAGYRKQLKQPVENALGHIENLISSIPGPYLNFGAKVVKDLYERQ